MLALNRVFTIKCFLDGPYFFQMLIKSIVCHIFPEMNKRKFLSENQDWQGMFSNIFSDVKHDLSPTKYKCTRLQASTKWKELARGHAQTTRTEVLDLIMIVSTLGEYL